MFFAVSSQILDIKTKEYTKCVILRMRSVMSLDADALRNLEQFVDRCGKKGISVVFSHVNPQPMKAMKKSGLFALAGEENFCANIDKAIERAESFR